MSGAFHCPDPADLVFHEDAATREVTAEPWPPPPCIRISRSFLEFVTERTGLGYSTAATFADGVLTLDVSNGTAQYRIEGEGADDWSVLATLVEAS